MTAAATLGATPLFAARQTDEDLSGPRVRGKTVLETFDYRGVHLLPSIFSRQMERTRDVYFGLSNEDVLHGFRSQAGMPSPGQNMTGWCSKTCTVVFGQWLSGMARCPAH